MIEHAMGVSVLENEGSVWRSHQTERVECEGLRVQVCRLDDGRIIYELVLSHSRR